MSTPRVSVVIPCYNYGCYLLDAVNSVKNQTFDAWEIVIADDGSKRETKDIVDQCALDPRISALHLNHEGPSKARNAAIQASCGEYILPLDADDMIGPTYLEKAVTLMDSDPKLGIVTCEAEFFGGMSGKWELPEYSLPEILLGNCIFVTSLFRREDWVTVGGFDESMRDEWEDYDFWLKVIELPRNVYRIPEVLFFYRKGHVSRGTKTLQDLTPLYLEIFKRHKKLYVENIEVLFQSHIKHSFLQQQITADQLSRLPRTDMQQPSGLVSRIIERASSFKLFRKP